MTGIRLLKAAAILLGLSAASLSLRPAEMMARTLITEDRLSSLAVARNIAVGLAPTIDGERLTNGFQPLFTFLCALAYIPFGGDRIEPLRVILLMHALIYVATALLLGLIARDAWPDGGQAAAFRRWVTTALYLSAGFVFRQHHNGLETGAVLLLYAACWRYYQRVGVETWSRAATFGVLLGLLTLARIDAAFLAVIWALSRVRRAEPIALRVGQAAIVAGTAFLVSLPWWAYNVAVFDSIIPTSGLAFHDFGVSIERAYEMLAAVARALTPHLMFGPFENSFTLAIRFAVIAVMAVAVVTALRRLRASPAPEAPMPARTLEFSRLLAIHVSVLALVYVSAFEASWFYSRYMAPGMPLAIVALGMAASAWGPRLRRFALTAALASTLGLALVVAMLQLGMSGIALNPHFDHQLALVRPHVPAGEPVAAEQSGTLGYFRDRVVNCDGKVNAEALAYRGQGLNAYLAARRINYFVDEGAAALLDLRAWRFVAASGTFELYERRPHL